MASPIRPTPTMPTRSLIAFMASSPWSSLRMSRLRLEHRRQRLGWIGKLGRIDLDAALDQPPRGCDLALGIDAGGVAQSAAVEIEAQHGVGADLPVHPRRLRQRPANALDIEIVLLGPERRRRVVDRFAARRIAARDRAMLLGVAPVLQP